MKWVEVIVKTSPENEDLVTNILYEAGAAGLAIEDPQDLVDLTENRESWEWDFIDSNLLKFPHDGVGLKAYFSESDDIKKIVDFIEDRIVRTPMKEDGQSYGEVILNSIDDEEFAESWKKYYKPLRIGEKIVIKPSWEDYEVEENDILIELDPGMAFGTGTHETTSLCVEALESFVKPGNHIYDIGCGSGILSIVAAKLGAKKVVGIDIDPVCVEVSNENIKLNKVDHIVKAYQGDLFEVVDEKVDLIVSNIIAEMIAGMVEDLNKYLLDNGIFIASGIILSKVDLVENALLENGFKIIEIKRLREWACIIAQK